MRRLREAVLDVVCIAYTVKYVPPSVDLMGHIAELCPLVD
jgi:hypothetical protein